MAESRNCTRIVLADDHRLFLAGVANLLPKHFDVVAEVDDSTQLMETVLNTRPDVVLLDVAMPGKNGIELAREIRRRLPATKIICVSVHDEPSFVDAALRAGACGYVLKTSAPDDLIRAIDEALQDRVYVSPELDRRSRPSTINRATLTPRQQEVLKLLSSGLSTKEIAEKLFITTKAVDFHRGRIRGALGLRTTAELIRYAIANGLVDL